MPTKKSYGKHSKKRSAYKKKSVKKSYKKKRGVKRKKSFKKPSAKRFKSSKKRGGLMVGVTAPSSLAEIPADASDMLKGAMMAAYNASRQSTTICRNPRAPISDRYWCKFHYAATAVNFPSVTTGSGYSIYVANGLFAPFNGGQKPQFFTNLGKIYAYYRVFAARMKCRFQSSSAGSLPDGKNSLVIIPTVFPNAAWASYLPGNQETLDTYQGPYKQGFNGTLGTTPDELGHVSCYAKTKEMFGISDLSDQNFGALMTTAFTSGSNPAPAYQWYFAVGSMDPVGVAAPLLVGSVEIEFWTLLDGPVQGTDITEDEVEDKGTMDMSDPAVDPWDEEEISRLELEEKTKKAAPPPVYTPTLKRSIASAGTRKV